MTDQARILLVEDDGAIATVIGVAMRAESISVDRVATLAERNERLSRQHYDAIVTDVILPDGNGLDDLPTLMPSLPPVVVLS
ncbi:MAG: response regulator, partial [Sphingopyxis sp.]|nr:response regulator [Sphingopyxis sp.]